MIARALFTSALCLHLLIAGLSLCAQSSAPAANLSDREALFTASQQRDCLVARPTSASLSLDKAPRRSDHLTAAIINRPVPLTLAAKSARTVDLATTAVYAARAFAASRAPPSLAA